jgi:hypothetical protein
MVTETLPTHDRHHERRSIDNLSSNYRSPNAARSWHNKPKLLCPTMKSIEQSGKNGLTSISPKPMLPNRGEVWLVNLDPTVGAEIKKTRPIAAIIECQESIDET